MIFGALIDIECLVQVQKYKPVSFKSVVPYCREILFIIGIVSFVITLVTIAYSFLAFTTVVEYGVFLHIFYDCIAVKAICWAPFLAFEYYDTIFENIYVDVRFQLNPIKPIQAQRQPRRPISFDDDDGAQYGEQNEDLIVPGSSGKVSPSVPQTEYM
jgi:hypothetical protein